MDDGIDDVSEDDKKKKNPDDISNDKLIKQTKKKANGTKRKVKAQK
jgi:replication factor C subunit 1